MNRRKKSKCFHHGLTTVDEFRDRGESQVGEATHFSKDSITKKQEWTRSYSKEGSRSELPFLNVRERSNVVKQELQRAVSRIVSSKKYRQDVVADVRVRELTKKYGVGRVTKQKRKVGRTHNVPDLTVYQSLKQVSRRTVRIRFPGSNEAIDFREKKITISSKRTVRSRREPEVTRF